MTSAFPTADSAREVPLGAPFYRAPIAVACRRFFQKYATFSGRASLSEYWWWALVAVVIGLGFRLAEAVENGGGSTVGTDGEPLLDTSFGTVAIVSLLWALATVVPTLSLLVRRLHDANFSAWMLLVAFVPFIGGLVLFVLTLLPSREAGRRFDGPLPGSA